MNAIYPSNPFVGLRPFESTESLLFFGRQEQTLELLQRLHEHHFVAVVGSSGSGKSSLIRAGLIPALKAGYLVDDRDHWMIAVLKPGESPLYNLAAAILNQLNSENNSEQLTRLTKKIKEDGADAVINILKPLWENRRTNIFLLVDQFEELFRFSQELKWGDKIDEANDFVNIILELSQRKDLPVYIVITMRSDFIGDCARFFSLPEAMNQSQYLVPRLNRVQLKNVIEGPVKLYGAKINPALTARLLNDLHLTKDELPILQHALMRTWDVWKNKNAPDTSIDIKDYLETGTMEHALSQHAEEAYAALNDRQKNICEIMFKALTDKESDTRGVRRPQRLNEIAMSAEASIDEVKVVVDAFRKTGRTFLMPAENIILNETSIIDISHESLMRIWDKLAQWVEEENQSEQIYLRLSQAADLYENGTGGLWRNPELQIALNWKKEYLPNEAWARRSNNSFSKAMLFLEKSRLQAEFELNEKEKLQRQSLRRARTFAMLISLIAIAAIILAIYAFNKTKEANQADKKTKEALQQQQLAFKKADEQRKIADVERSKALNSEQYALQQKDSAQQQKELADSETKNAVSSKQEALYQQKLAEEQKQFAENQKTIAEKNAAEAERQQQLAEQQTDIATQEKQKSNRLKELAESRIMANEAVLLLNENRFDSSKNLAIKAYQINKINNGPVQNNDIYNALYLNWIKIINNKNQYQIHKLPVHCIAGMPSGNIIFTADESGMLYESAIVNDSFQKKAEYSVKEEVRALAVAPDGKKLISITASGNGKVFNISSSGISPAVNFKFSGIGKAIAFINNENFILLSTAGIGQFQLKNISTPVFLNNNIINAFVVGKTGKLYIATGNQVKIYKDWDDLVHDSSIAFPKFDSKVTTLAVSDNEQYIAAGTYNGFVWIRSLNDNSGIWDKALRLSSVNDLKFGTVDNDELQLAVAGADQTIKLINVKAILQKNNTEDIITLRGHTKWVYALYYSPDGKWLFSTSEDDKVIAWKPAMHDLYQSLSK